MTKLRIFLSSVFVAAGVCTSFACGPYDNMVSNPFKFHFYQEDERPVLVETQENENIGLWGKLTSPEIPAEAIYEGVYKYSLKDLKHAFADSIPSNEFIKWINDHHADNLRNFLLLAKELEEMRHHRVSPWYFPSDKSGFDKARSEKERFDSIVTVCSKYTGGRLADRYGLQAVRALMSMGQFQDCIDYYNRNMSRFSDSNLFKRMAKGYIAGAKSRLGYTEEANRMFAEVGDFNSITGEKPLEVLARYNPESEVVKYRLNGFIGYGNDSTNVKYLSMADAALSSPRVVNRGDWLYLKAYIEAIYRKNNSKALGYVSQALNSSFSRSEMRDDARLFDICLRAGQGDLSGWQTNSQWIINEYGNTDGLFFYLVPALLKKGMKTEALLLANYNTAGHPAPWANTGFQALLTMKASDVVAYKRALTNPKLSFVKKIKQGINCDEDYLNDIIGTLYLREGNYAQAEKYLAKVSEEYQKSMNIYRYLSYDPWTYCYTPEDKWSYPPYNWGDYYDGYYDDFIHGIRPDTQSSKLKKTADPINAKYNFARQMMELKMTMSSGKSSDDRGLARLKYAIGRYNSLNTCWALTQYWLGTSNQCDYQPFYWTCDGDTRRLDYLLDSPRQLKGCDEWFEQQVMKAMGELKSDEALAEANLILRNYRTIARHYPATAAGKYLASHCDSWSDWL